jgi:hypothetical protein
MYQWHGGKMNGHGSLSFASGNMYTGAFLDGHMHGRGRLAYSNNNIYEGEFAHGVPEVSEHAYMNEFIACMQM